MTRRRSNYEESFWTTRTNVEVILIGILSIIFLLSTVLIILLSVGNKSSIPECYNSQCINRAAEIFEHVDTNINPCDNFYKFSCGKFLHNAHGDEKLGALLSVQENVDRQLLELYTEPEQQDEHRTVKFAKKLFKACMNTTAIENDSITPIKNILNVLGGWPVVDGAHWDENSFNWIQTTKKLRQLGYPFSIYLDLSVTSDPLNKNKHIIEVSIPIEEFFFSVRDYERKRFMINFAVYFGANKNDAIIDIENLLQFQEQLHQRNYSSKHIAKEHRRYNLSHFQQKHGYYVNWLEFINSIISPAAVISENDFVIFPQTDILHNWLHLISKTSKRNQANYMMWKVIEKTLPHLIQNLQNENYMQHNEKPRSKFCLEQSQKRFLFSPINVMYARRYLTLDMKITLGIVTGIIREKFIEAVFNTSWIEKRDKECILQKIEKTKIILGAPEGYLDDKMLDELDVDLKTVKDASFLNLLSQANKNLLSCIYGTLIKSRDKIISTLWYHGTISDYDIYDKENNVLRIPATLLQGALFNVDRSVSSIFGEIGSVIANELTSLTEEGCSDINEYSTVTTNKITNARKKYIISCTQNNVKNLELHDTNLLVNETLRKTIVLQTVYSAYSSWLRNYEEPQLVATKYSPRQLFWISTTFLFCRPISFYDNLFNAPKELNYHTSLLNEAIKNNRDFATDFQCSENSDMNPIKKCFPV